MSMDATVKALIKALEQGMYNNPPGNLTMGAPLQVENLSSVFDPTWLRSMEERPKTEEEKKLARMFYEDYDQ